MTDANQPDQVASHTPGPWMLDPAHPLMVYCDDALGSRVADLSQPGHGIPWAQEEANARLIAAAPDLLTLAKQYASACINCGGSAEIIRNKSSDGDPLHDFAEPCPECEHIRDAIAKATGEHS